MLANDYNSRCSNFYYLDEDLKLVTEEVKTKKQILQAERILSTWPLARRRVKQRYASRQISYA
jgi:hypothetical protein